MSSRVISFSPQLNNSVINPPQLSSDFQKSSISSHNTPCDNGCFNTRDSNSKINEFSSPVIPVTPVLNDLVINPLQLYLVCQHSSSSLDNTTHELQDSSTTGRTSPDPSNTMTLPFTNNGSCNIYECMVGVYILTPAQQQQHSVMSLQHYYELCNTNDPSQMFVSPLH